MIKINVDDRTFYISSDLINRCPNARLSKVYMNNKSDGKIILSSKGNIRIMDVDVNSFECIVSHMRYPDLQFTDINNSLRHKLLCDAEYFGFRSLINILNIGDNTEDKNYNSSDGELSLNESQKINEFKSKSKDGNYLNNIYDDGSADDPYAHDFSNVNHFSESIKTPAEFENQVKSFLKFFPHLMNNTNGNIQGESNKYDIEKNESPELLTDRENIYEIKRGGNDKKQRINPRDYIEPVGYTERDSPSIILSNEYNANKDTKTKRIKNRYININ